MASYPYTSTQSALTQTFEQFRKTFPPTVDASTLKRFSIAPANESYIINILRFLGFIDEDGKKVETAAGLFLHGDEKFKSDLEGVIRTSYSDLFTEHGDDAWGVSRDVLATWFRVKDKTSDLIGKRQANTFLTLASLAGHGEPVKPSKPSANGARSKPKASKEKATAGPRSSGSTVSQVTSSQTNPSSTSQNDRVGLTVRVEVNLPASGTPEVYDAIFASIRKNLIDQ